VLHVHVLVSVVSDKRNLFLRLLKRKNFAGMEHLLLSTIHLQYLNLYLIMVWNFSTTCWSLFDRSSNFNQSARDSQTALGVHSFESISRNEIHMANEHWRLLSCLAQHLFYFACWEFCNTPGQFKDIGFIKLKMLFMLIQRRIKLFKAPGQDKTLTV